MVCSASMQRKIGTAIHHAALPFYLLSEANGTAQEKRAALYGMKEMSSFSGRDEESEISTNTCNCTKNEEQGVRRRTMWFLKKKADMNVKKLFTDLAIFSLSSPTPQCKAFESKGLIIILWFQMCADLTLRARFSHTDTILSGLSGRVFCTFTFCNVFQTSLFLLSLQFYFS